MNGVNREPQQVILPFCDSNIQTHLVYCGTKYILLQFNGELTHCGFPVALKQIIYTRNPTGNFIAVISVISHTNKNGEKQRTLQIEWKYMYVQIGYILFNCKE